MQTETSRTLEHTDKFLFVCLVCFQDPGSRGWEWYFLCVCLPVSAKRWNNCLSVCGKQVQYNRKDHTDYIFVCLRTCVCLMTGTACICICMSVVCLVNFLLWGMKLLQWGQKRQTYNWQRGDTVMTSSLPLLVSLVYSTLLPHSLPNRQTSKMPPLTQTPIACCWKLSC